uniref:Uncharacterized protein n=1 Tax=Anopheles darlingi TaxID=43151 RepID=A0A2M4DLX1_ANODA
MFYETFFPGPAFCWLTCFFSSELILLLRADLTRPYQNWSPGILPIVYPAFRCYLPLLLALIIYCFHY